MTHDPRPGQPQGLYIHIPFCRHKCLYCDFNTYAGLEGLIPDFLGALRREIAAWGAVVGRPHPASSRRKSIRTS